MHNTATIEIASRKITSKELASVLIEFERWEKVKINDSNFYIYDHDSGTGDQLLIELKLPTILVLISAEVCVDYEHTFESGKYFTPDQTNVHVDGIAIDIEDIDLYGSDEEDIELSGAQLKAIDTMVYGSLTKVVAENL